VIIESSLANIIWAGQNIHKKYSTKYNNIVKLFAISTIFAYTK